MKDVCQRLLTETVVPELIGSVVAVYNGKVFNTVEIRPEMVGQYVTSENRLASSDSTNTDSY